MITVGKSYFGKGLFATSNIAAGTVLIKIKGTKLKFRQTTILGNKESYPLQIETDEYILCDPFTFCNHSCVPNCGINADLEFYALRKIKKGEELAWDYSTSMLERHWEMRCKCGSVSCRKIIKDFDKLPQKIQYRYLNMEIVLPYIVRFLKEATLPLAHTG